MPTVQLNGTEIFYIQAGKGIPCLVMHGGLGCDHTYMHPWMDALGDTFELTYYDHRGNGRSGRPPVETLSFAQFAADADALRAHLGHEKIAVMGSSYGGFIAQEYAIRYPERVSLLVLMDTAPAFDYKDDVLFHARRKGATPEMLEALESLNPSTDQEMADMMHLIGPLYYYRYDAALDTAAMGKTLYCGSAAKRGFELLEGWSTLDRLSGVRAPTLVLVGRDDYITPPQQSERIRDRIPGAELVVFEQSGHMPHLEEPEAFFAAIRGWAGRNAGQSEAVAGR
ncbi:MAG: alpha/beta hydrolase [Meiothermus sp.]|nr:alpha/beta hydrolase [Meiothermus sp.]